MSEAETQAYEEALRRIQDAEESGATELALLFDGCQHLRELPRELSRLRQLRELTLTGWFELRDLTSLSGLESLQRLKLNACWQLKDVAPLSGLTSLWELRLDHCILVRDLTPLNGLTSLHRLNLSGCKQVRDLTPLSGLTSLQRLNVYWCEQITDLTPLTGLSSLQELWVGGCEQLTDLRPLSGLMSLRFLAVFKCDQLTKLKPLSGLASLRQLVVSGCGQITDLTPVSELTLLKRLTVSGSDLLSDLTPLSGLTLLQQLDLSWCGQLRDLTPLSGLTSLQQLNVSGCGQISDLTPLTGLESLEALNLSSCGQIRDLTPLSRLKSLEALNMSSCGQLRDLKPLSGLESLQSVNLSYCRAETGFAPLEPILPRLYELRLYGSEFKDLPAEICGEEPEADVLPQVRAYYVDLNEGYRADAEVKVLFLGNGGVGKSQLCRRIRDLPYDPGVQTTHGIQLSDVVCEAEGLPHPVRLNLWDFGGQEVYHGAHALFLQGAAVFLILWTPDRERDALPYEENGLAMRHRPLAYWLDYVRAFARRDSPVLLVQSQCDTAAQRCGTLPGKPHLDDFAAVQTVQVSARTGLGVELIRAALKEAVRDCLERRPPPPIGVGRIRVRERLRDLLAADQQLPAGDRRHRWLGREEFEQLCADEGGISDTGAFLEFLHHSGVVFYRRGVFHDRIILDQNWALEAVYALFDRNRTLPLLRGYGRFTRADLEALVWAAYTREEQMVFLGMMESCGICFRSRRVSDEEWEYIAPELLPPWSEAQDRLLAGRLLQVPPDDEAEARYVFLHEGILRSFLSRIGEQAGDAAIYWRYGCWFYEKTTDSRVLIQGRWDDTEAQSGAGSIQFQAWGQRAKDLLDPLLRELQKLPIGQTPDIPDRKAVRSNVSSSRSLDPDDTPSPDVASLQISETVHASAGAPSVYISYAWGDESSAGARQRGEVVDRLCAELGRAGWNVIRDRTAMRSGDLITDFIKTITRADHIVVVLSGKYLRSAWCMAELYGIYQRSTGEKRELLERIVPLALEDAKISGWRDRVEIARHWESEFQEMEKNLTHLGAADLCLYKAMQDWHNRVGDILAHVSDVLRPVGFETIVKDEFAGLKEMLARRAAAPGIPHA